MHHPSITHTGPYHYSLFGLLIASDEAFGQLPVPSMAMAPGARRIADVRIQWHEPLPLRPIGAPLRFTTSIAGGRRLDVHTVAGGTLWHYPDETRFWVSDAADVVRAEAPAHYTAEDVVTYLVGPILGFVLRQRGIPVLHASSVVIGGRTIAIAGPAGAGKSTLTAELVRRGHQLLAEDVSAICDLSPAPQVAPGVGFVKLWSDSAERHGVLPLLTPNWSKRYLAAEVPGAPRALDVVAFLQAGESSAATPLDARSALVELLNNAYVSYALTPKQRARDLEQLGTLADRVPAVALTRTADFGDLDELCEIVEATLR